RVAVVIGNEIDLAAVDAALGIDLVEKGLLGLADHAVSGGRTAIGHDVADLDFGVGGAGVVFLLCECGGRGGCKQGKRGRNHGQASAGNGHCVSPSCHYRRCVSWPSRTEGSLFGRKLPSRWNRLNQKPLRQSRRGCFFSSQPS